MSTNANPRSNNPLQTYRGWLEYDFNTALAEALASAKAKPRTNADLSTALYWRQFNKANGTPSENDLQRHVKFYGREGTEPFIGLTREAAGDLARKSAEANLKESARKRTRRRSGVKQQVASLLERNPNLMPAAIADTLNLSDRRVKQILSELAAAA